MSLGDLAFKAATSLLGVATVVVGVSFVATMGSGYSYYSQLEKERGSGGSSQQSSST